jgi:hypothetical protein
MLPRSRAAAASASVANSVRMWSAIDQPTRRREKQDSRGVVTPRL